ncbi:MAG: hypothetical protein HY473_00520 [Candidatus Sungbacteria bacterium]|uniref:Uncharacterized protein n=1 Tax=Candidatus Sungiibacteriota bacterium TaxID=2750080 RepID=A0A932YW94_9BACT|nr:hypothetical protein [Candidatus Sungbacteria bacterium]
MTTSVSEKKLRNLIRESVKEALGTELAKLRALALPEVSAKEQRDIERRYGRPSRKRGRSYAMEV